MMKEIFKDIPGYEGLYQVSNLGRVKSYPRKVKIKGNGTRTIKGRVLKPMDNRGVYLHVDLWKNRKCTHSNIHRLVALAFLGECPKGYVVNHIDEDKHNNIITNLEYVTPSQNSRHGTSIKRMAEKHRWWSKQRKGVMQYTLDGKEFCWHRSISAAERATGIPHTNISTCCLGKVQTAGGYMWKHKEGEYNV